MKKKHHTFVTISFEKPEIADSITKTSIPWKCRNLMMHDLSINDYELIIVDCTSKN